MEIKICTKCLLGKPEGEFYMVSKGGGRRYPLCKKCHAARGKEYAQSERGKAMRTANRNKPEHRARRKVSSLKYLYRTQYGMTLQDYDNMLVAQDHKCAVCSGPPTRDGRFHVDHCHATGNIRGLLCHQCNMGLGHVRDNTDTLRRMIDYLNVKR